VKRASYIFSEYFRPRYFIFFIFLRLGYRLSLASFSASDAFLRLRQAVFDSGFRPRFSARPLSQPSAISSSRRHRCPVSPRPPDCPFFRCFRCRVLILQRFPPFRFDRRMQVSRLQAFAPPYYFRSRHRYFLRRFIFSTLMTLIPIGFHYWYQFHFHFISYFLFPAFPSFSTQACFLHGCFSCLAAAAPAASAILFAADIAHNIFARRYFARLRQLFSVLSLQRF